MSHVIIGIHGLSNKPDADTLARWWKRSIVEGLKKNEGIDNPSLNFTSVYWADVMYSKPDPDPDRYKPARKSDLRTYADSWLDAVRARTFDWSDNILDEARNSFGWSKVADAVLRHKLKDLSQYYENEGLRDELRGRLRERILDHQDQRIMVIAHSMGSIIAYDVLRALGQGDSRRGVEHFVTIGSPLGLPHVKYKIALENPRVRTPSVVHSWSNFADKRDPVAFDTHLGGDYAANSRGVRVEDDLVNNDWGKIYHKSYGYLRAPEVSRVIKRFI